VFTIPVEGPRDDRVRRYVARLPWRARTRSFSSRSTKNPSVSSSTPSTTSSRTAAEVPTGSPSTNASPAIAARVSPNPARDTARIEFFLDEAGDVNLDVYDAAGRRVAHHRSDGPRGPECLGRRR